MVVCKLFFNTSNLTNHDAQIKLISWPHPFFLNRGSVFGILLVITVKEIYMIQGQCARRLCFGHWLWQKYFSLRGKLSPWPPTRALPWTRCIHNFQAIINCLTPRSRSDLGLIKCDKRLKSAVRLKNACHDKCWCRRCRYKMGSGKAQLKEWLSVLNEGWGSQLDSPFRSSGLGVGFYSIYPNIRDLWRSNKKTGKKRWQECMSSSWMRCAVRQTKAE